MIAKDAQEWSLLEQILRGSADSNIGFEDMRHLLISLGGAEERIRGSHHTDRKADVEKKLNIQRDGAKAKAYQVRTVIVKYGLGG